MSVRRITPFLPTPHGGLWLGHGFMYPRRSRLLFRVMLDTLLQWLLDGYSTIIRCYPRGKSAWGLDALRVKNTYCHLASSKMPICFRCPQPQDDAVSRTRCSRRSDSLFIIIIIFIVIITIIIITIIFIIIIIIIVGSQVHSARGSDSLFLTMINIIVGCQVHGARGAQQAGVQ